MKKVQLLLSVRQGQSPNMLEAVLASAGQRARSLLPKGSRHRRSFRLADDPVLKVPHGAAVTGGPRFDAMFEVASDALDLAQLTSAVEGLASRLEQWVDPGASAVIAGQEHVIVPGDGPLMLVYALRPLPSLSSAQFHDYWLNRHAGTAKEAVMREAAPEPAVTGPQLRGYRQFHADPVATRAAAKAAGVAIDDFEGAAEGYYSDVDEFLQIMLKPEVVSEALEDEKRFIDVTRSVIIVTRMAWNTSG